MSTMTNPMMTEALETLKGTNKKVATDEIKEAREQLDEGLTKSAMIRELSRQGFERADIARVLNIRYQHVRNVLVQKLKKAK